MVKKESSNECSNQEDAEVEQPTQTPAGAQADDEFKITVKKLDKVIRPRGVLADG